MNIKTYSRLPRKKTNPFKHILIAIVGLVLLIAVSQASATSIESDRTELPKITKTVNVSSKKETPVKTTQEAPAVVVPPAPVVEPVPAPVDPNGCDAQGMWWRADNYECVAKLAPVVEVAAQASVAVAVIHPTGGANCELARSLIAQYDWNQQSAYDVMYQESTCNSGATNAGDVHATCLGSYGLFQISCENGVIYDPAANVAQAYKMYQSRGWAPWGFTTCKLVACN